MNTEHIQSHHQSHIAEILHKAPDLAELGHKFHADHERLDHGKIHYTTTPEAIKHWAEDPHGTRKFAFMSEAFGIPQDELPQVLTDMGLETYLQCKEEGRLVGLIATQVLKPTYYFFSNVLLLGHLAKEHHIPTALMVGTYDTDIFVANNSDKAGAFGDIEFPVGLDEMGNTHAIKIHVSPAGIKEPDGTIRPIQTIQEASGIACNQIMVRVNDAQSTHNMRFTKHRPQEDTSLEQAHFLTRAALGFDIDQEAISLTDFYRLLWIQTINTLRKEGELPSEEEMPMFFVDAKQLYTTLPKRAQPPPSVVRTINTGNESCNDPNVTRLPSGILVRKQSGVMDPSWYYPMQFALADLMFECSSCGGDKFVDKLAKADEVIESFGLHTPEVRLPDKEFPILEKLCLHPSHRHVSMSPVKEAIKEAQMRCLDVKNEIQEHLHSGSLTKEEARQRIRLAENDRDALSQSTYDSLQQTVQQSSQNDEPFIHHKIVIPPVIAAIYKELLLDVDIMIQSEKVQEALNVYHA